jgi:hypothetical protein
LRFVFSLLPFREVRRSADVGGDLFWLQGVARGFPVLRPLADSLAILGTADVVVEVEGERSVAQKLKLVFYSDERGKVADAMASLDGLLYFVGFSFSRS